MHFLILGVNIKSDKVHVFSILYGHINVPLACKELNDDNPFMEAFLLIAEFPRINATSETNSPPHPSHLRVLNVMAEEAKQFLVLPREVFLSLQSGLVLDGQLAHVALVVGGHGGVTLQSRKEKAG